ncbi:RNA polymerase sigma factor [Paenibacillus sp. FSL R7-0337]|uniref:RNA polymerase sigma factor n=1 Tax=Paenibacillus sp. FSL R7-0337 TaxID=1926588 RepID=UPI002116B920|nr:RNA polymerase sigma factor [Paenibacillus sp. FSL R7-0337]
MEQGNPGGPPESKKIEEAIHQVHAGDRQAFTTIITEYERKIYTYCYYLLRNREEAEDAVQDIFVKVYQQLRRYEKRVSFSAWLYKVAYHHCLDQLRRRKRRSRLLSLYKLQLMTHQQELPEEPPVDRILENLTSEERGLLILRVIEQYSFEEISMITGSSSAALRKKYERLRKKLIQQKADEGRECAHGEMAESN